MKAAQWVGNHSIVVHEWSLARTLKAFSFLALSTLIWVISESNSEREG